MNNENIKTGYKIICLNMASFSRPFTYGGIEYKLNQKVYPRKGCGPLCVFDTLEDVKNFSDFFIYDNAVRIFKCKYEESEEDKIWDYFHEISLSDLPYGTKLADWVELTEEIKL